VSFDSVGVELHINRNMLATRCDRRETCRQRIFPKDTYFVLCEWRKHICEPLKVKWCKPVFSIKVTLSALRGIITQILSRQNCISCWY